MASEGKRHIYNTALFLKLIAFIFFFIAFSSPNWFQSWPRVFSQFKKVGLWEACFAGLVLPMDYKMKAYHGCWWILATEFKGIRDWLMPPWFVFTQVACTLILIGFILNIMVMLHIWLVTSRDNESRTGKKRAPMNELQTSTAVTVIMALLMTFVVILFGIEVFHDRNWMPNPDLNYLSWSYGMAVLAAFFLIFTSIAQVTYTRIVRQELREPPSAPAVAVYGGKH